MAENDPLAPPNTHVYSLARGRMGYRINRLSMDMTDPSNREAFKADETAYMTGLGMTETEQELVLARDWRGLVDAGGNIYTLVKLAGTVGHNLLAVGAQMRGETFDEFMATRPGTDAKPMADGL